MPPETTEGGSSAVTVWDTHYAAPSKAFRFYRDALCSVYMPWIARTESPGDFQGRFEAMPVKGGSIGHSRCSPMVCTRTRAELSHSDDEHFFALYVLSGFHACEQNGRANRANPGEIILIDSGQPCRIETGSPPYEVLCISVPKAELRGIRNLEDKMGNTVVKGGSIAAPVLDCANLIARELTSAPQEELVTLYDACVSLLPLAAGCFADEHRERLSGTQNNLLLRAMLEFASHNLGDPNLCPQQVADHFGISVRYVHKLFACTGTTFRSHVTAMRLDNLSSELLSSGWNRHVAELAYRWGFTDLSVFNRSFRRRYGCAPTQFRNRSE